MNGKVELLDWTDLDFIVALGIRKGSIIHYSNGNVSYGEKIQVLFLVVGV